MSIFDKEKTNQKYASAFSEQANISYNPPTTRTFHSDRLEWSLYCLHRWLDISHSNSFVKVTASDSHGGMFDWMEPANGGFKRVFHPNIVDLILSVTRESIVIEIRANGVIVCILRSLAIAKNGFCYFRVTLHSVRENRGIFYFLL